MSRLGLIAALILFALPTCAEELCADWERKIEPDMQMEESDFTLEAAERALERLDRLIREPSDELTWIAIGNSTTVVIGWLYKKDALAARENSGEESTDVHAVRVFCEFLVNEAYYYD